MPIFEYRCKKCGHVTEFLEKNRSPRKHICGKCKCADLQKLPSSFTAGRSSDTTSQSDGSCPTGTCPMNRKG